MVPTVAGEGAWGRFEVMLIVLLLLVSYFYASGTVRLWLRNGPGRGVRFWQSVSFAGGIAALLLAWTGPLSQSEEPLFCLDTVRRMVLFSVAAPLLVLGGPLAAICRGLPRGFRRPALSWLTRMAGARRGNSALASVALLQATILWLCHVPIVLQSAHSSNAVMWLIDAALFVSATGFWAVATPARYATAHPNGASAAWLFVSFGVVWTLASGLTNADTLLYPAYDYGVADETWSAMVDQQLGGLLIGLASLTYLVAGVAMLVRWRRSIRQTDQSTAMLADSLPIAATALLSPDDTITVAATPRP